MDDCAAHNAGRFERFVRLHKYRQSECDNAQLPARARTVRVDNRRVVDTARIGVVLLDQPTLLGGVARNYRPQQPPPKLLALIMI